MKLPDFSFESRVSKRGYKIIAGVDEVGRGCFAGPVVAGCVIIDRRVMRSGGHQGRGPELASRRKGLGAAERQDPSSYLAVGPVRSSERVLSRNSPKSTRKGTPALGLPVARHPLILINDSKKLTSKQREIADIWIRKNALAFGIGQASVSEINKLGIKKATEIAFRKAIKSCQVKIDYLLIDAFYIPYVRGLRRRNQLPIIKGDTKSISIAAASIIAKVYRDKLMVTLSKNPKYKKYKWDKNKGYGTLIHRQAIKKYGPTRLHRKKFVETYLNNSSFSRVQ